MLGDSAVLSGGGDGSGDVAAAVGGGGAERAVSGGGGAVGSNSGDDERGGRIEEGERSSFGGGNRWPRQETLALLRIRSDMDTAFRDAAVKGPLWEEVSRKLAELGYHRNAKKCKEKFENVYKYHKRTKEGRSGKPDGKTYRFFDQLQALENHPQIQSPNSSKPPPQQPPPPPQPLVVATTVPMPIMPPPHVSSTVPSTTTPPPNIPMPQGIAIPTTQSMNLINSNPYNQQTNPISFPQSSTANPITTTNTTTTPISFPNMDLLSNSTSSSTSSDETLEGRRKRKRKWKDFFERLMKEVVEKQEDLQKRFLEAIEKREHDRTAREEAWRVQEMQRINREREILAQERSIAAAKDTAVMSFLQKIAEQQNLGPALSNINNIAQQLPLPKPVPQPSVSPAPIPIPVPAPLSLAPVPVAQSGPPTQSVMVGQTTPVPQQQVVTGMEIVKADNNGENFMAASSSRWPKVEVEALIKLRTELDAKYQENGPKGPLWEEISASMRRIGYNRNAKRCKEKWENINKYFKKVKESNKKRPEDSKTCPYFHQLDALYREKKGQVAVRPPESTAEAPLMVQPEQQWPPQQQQKISRDVTMEDAENDPMDRHHEDDDHENEEDDEEEDEEDESGGSGSGGGGGNYEIVASKPAGTTAE